MTLIFFASFLGVGVNDPLLRHKAMAVTDAVADRLHRVVCHVYNGSRGKSRFDTLALWHYGKQ
ncbi:MAG: hypothetical protein HYZ72_07540 [Deltaproteobacteria bacterium]|nr:hypothetical protein [Deltaproteobacteria bacterium]